MRTLFAKLSVVVALFCFIINGNAAETLISDPVVVNVAWDQVDRNDTGSDFRASVDIRGRLIACRERGDDTQTNAQGVTFFKFDLGSLSSDIVNRPGFSSVLSLAYLARVNATQNLQVNISRVPASNLWDDSIGSYPLATWVATTDLNAGYMPIDYILLDSVLNTAPPLTNTIDVTQDVVGWVNGTMTNNGYVMFGTPDSFQGAGFDEPVITISGAPELVDHWALDETSGTTAYNSTGGTNGTATAGVSVNQEGKIGKAYYFNSAGSVVNVSGYKGITNADARTVSVWIKTTSGAGRGILSWGKDATGDAWGLYLDSPNARLNIYGGYILGTNTVADGEWHNIVISFSGNDSSPNVEDVRMYVDGTLETVSGLPVTIHTGNELDVAIGNNRSRTSYFYGTMDDVAIWKSGLVAGEAKSLFELADEPALNYSASQVQTLWNLYYAGTGTVKIGSLFWSCIDGITGATEDGELLSDSTEKYYLVMDAASGRGLTSFSIGTMILVQ